MDPYRLYGLEQSPYSRKVRAALRYRRLPLEWVVATLEVRGQIAHVKPPLIPVLRHPDGRFQVDSTPILVELDQALPERRLLPPDPAAAFLCHLLEDMADEWLTKAMFHYRWYYAEDQETCSRAIASDLMPGAPEEHLSALTQHFRQRQIARMPLAGCTPEAAPLIEATLIELAGLLEPMAAGGRYLFGTRPSLADFALYGQLTQLTEDPTPQRLLAGKAPALVAWVKGLEDAAGVEGGWDSDIADATVEALLAFAGRVYLPYLEANAAAILQGEGSFTMEVDGHPLTQAPVGYQAKCLARLRALLAELGPDDRRRLDPVLARAGCLSRLHSLQAA